MKWKFNVKVFTSLRVSRILAVLAPPGGPGQSRISELMVRVTSRVRPVAVVVYHPNVAQVPPPPCRVLDHHVHGAKPVVRLQSLAAHFVDEFSILLM